jgi:hypothetical protein
MGTGAGCTWLASMTGSPEKLSDQQGLVVIPCAPIKSKSRIQEGGEAVHTHKRHPHPGSRQGIIAPGFKHGLPFLPCSALLE